MNRNRFSLCVAMVLMILTLVAMPVSPAVAQANIQPNSEITMATKSCLSFINHIVATNPNLDWKGSNLKGPQVYYDLTGNTDAFMFAVVNNNATVGHILVGSSAYGNPVFEAGEAPPAKFPTAQEIISSLKNSLGLTVDPTSIGNPVRLLYLGIDLQYGLYNINGELIGINLMFGDALKFSEMKMFLPSPDQYRVDSAAASAATPDSTLSTYFWLTMNYYNELPNRVWCGPCSGVSIGHYFKIYCVPPYSNLYADDPMYDDLYYHMGNSNFVPLGWYGPGWVQMAIDCGYLNFSYYEYANVGSSHYFNHIIPDINRGWPHALLCHTLVIGHWLGIKGYDYTTGTHYVICTDSEISQSWRYINWDSLPYLFHDTVGLHDI